MENAEFGRNLSEATPVPKLIEKKIQNIVCISISLSLDENFYFVKSMSFVTCHLCHTTTNIYVRVQFLL